MLPSSTSMAWTGGGGEEEADPFSLSWPTTTTTTTTHPAAAAEEETCKSHHHEIPDYFINNNNNLISSSSSTDHLPFSSFQTDTLYNTSPISSSFFAPTSYLSSLFSAISADPFDQSVYLDTNLPHFFFPNNPSIASSSNFPAFFGAPEVNLAEGFLGFGNNNMGLRPFEVLPTDGLQQQQQRDSSLFAAAAAATATDKCVSGEGGGVKLERKKKRDRDCDSGDEEDGEDVISCMNYYDSDEPPAKMNDCNVDRPDGSTGDYGADGNSKGKKKGFPAKNLMAERRRRKKLNDRLYMLRSIVPKISKMDRASILGDAIEYLKELLQRINDLHHELEANPPGSLMQQTSSFQPLTPPTLPTLPYRVKEELCLSSLPSPKNNQPARVEVRLREGKAVNIHMFCARRPGLLLSAISSLENLGLDIQQAVISSFNGFALDVFRAEQCSESQDVLPEQVKAVLLDSAGYHGIM